MAWPLFQCLSRHDQPARRNLMAVVRDVVASLRRVRVSPNPDCQWPWRQQPCWGFGTRTNGRIRRYLDQVPQLVECARRHGPRSNPSIRPAHTQTGWRTSRGRGLPMRRPLKEQKPWCRYGINARLHPHRLVTFWVTVPLAGHGSAPMPKCRPSGTSASQKPVRILESPWADLGWPRRAKWLSPY